MLNQRHFEGIRHWGTEWSERPATLRETAIANHAFRLLEGLNQSVEKNAVKTAVAEFYVIVVMFVTVPRSARRPQS
jgi:hypothetical protein